MSNLEETEDDPKRTIDYTLVLKWTADERAAMLEVARRNGQKRHEWARSLIMRELLNVNPNLPPLAGA